MEMKHIFEFTVENQFYVIQEFLFLSYAFNTNIRTNNQIPKLKNERI